MYFFVTFVHNLFISPDDSAFGKIVRRKFHSYFVTGKYPDEILAELTAYGSEYLMSVFKLYLKHCVGKLIYYNSLDFDNITF